MSNPRDNIEAKLGLSGPPLQTVRDAPPQIPDHELVRRIGQGAYGEVWLARNALGTWRAIKLVYRDNFKDARPYEREFAGIRRFEPLSRSNEGFVDVLQVGRDDAGGWFYYVMELADPASAECGTQNAELPLTGPLDTLSPAGGAGRGEGDAEIHKLTPHSALETPQSYTPRTLARDLHQRGRLPLEDCLQLGLNLTLALGHLHRHGLIHRDVKPSNIIYVGGVPKLADIGLVTEAQGANTFVGTEGFVPPEGPTSPQADLYALGKVLYEAAMGKDRNEFPEPFTQIGTDRESVALMELNAVLLRACAPDPRKRYATAEEMHAELALLHSGGSVKRRHQFDRQFQIAKQVGAVAIAATLLIGGAWFWQRQQTQKMTRLANEKSALASENSRLANAAKQNELLTRQNLYAADMNLAQQALVANNLGLLRALLENHVPKPGEQDLRGFEWRYLWEQSRSEELFCLRAQTDRSRVVSFMPDGRHLATGGEDGAVRIWELDSRREVASLAITGAVRSVAFSSTGDRMAIVTADSLSLSDTRTWSPLRQFTEPGWFSPSGSYLLITERSPSLVSKIPLTSRLLLLDSVSYSVVKALDLPEEWKHPLMAEAGRWVAFSRDGMRIAVQCADAIRLFSLPDFREVGFVERQLKAGASANPFVRFSPDNQTLATLDSTGFGVRFWDTDSRHETRIIPGHADALCAASFSPDGSRLATCSADQTIKLWAVATGNLIRSFRGQAEDLSFSPDGKLLASVGADGAVRLWDAEAKPRQDFFREPVGPIGFNAEPKLMAFGEDAKLSLIDPVSQLITGSDKFTLTNSRIIVQRLDAITAESGPRTERCYAPYLGNLSRDGRTVGLFDVHKQAMDFWDLLDGKLLCSVAATKPWVAFAPSRQLVATDTTNATTTVWRLPTGTRQWVFTNRVGLFQAVAFSPDENFIVTDEGTNLKLWRVGEEEVTSQLTFNPKRWPVIGLAFSPDGRLLATGESGGSIKLWAIPSALQVGVFSGHTQSVISLAFGPDGCTLASMCDDRTVRLWNVATRREMLRFQSPAPDHYYFSLAFSPDNSALAARRVDDQGPITWVWHAPSLSEISQRPNK